jgi:16S rRNA (uracil1498-N3)-methyltransferase
MHRFFIPASWIEGDRVTIVGPQAHQIADVLRMRPGDRLAVLDNSGWEIETRLLMVDRHAIRGEVVSRRLSESEPRTKVSLYQGVLKGKRFEFTLQKGTELGIVEFVPVIADRCVLSDLAAVEQKRERWEWIIQEAAEQSHRGRKPALRVVSLFPQACEQLQRAGGLSLMLWEEEERTSLRDVLRQAPPGFGGRFPPFTVHLMIGPEGGFTREEASIARRYGLVPVKMGPRILRGETAGIVAATIVLYELGDLQ